MKLRTMRCAEVALSLFESVLFPVVIITSVFSVTFFVFVINNPIDVACAMPEAMNWIEQNFWMPFGEGVTAAMDWISLNVFGIAPIHIEPLQSSPETQAAVEAMKTEICQAS